MAASGTPSSPWAAWRAAAAAVAAGPERAVFWVLAGFFGWAVGTVAVQAAISGLVTQGHPCVRIVAGVEDPTICPAGGAAASAGLALGIAAACVLGQVFWAIQVHAALSAAGRPAPVRPFLITGAAVVVSLMITLAVGFGIVPALVLMLLTQFVLVTGIAERCGPVSALVRGIRYAVRHPVVTVSTGALAVLSYALGAMLLGVGLIPAVAVVVRMHLIVITGAPLTEDRAC